MLKKLIFPLLASSSVFAADDIVTTVTNELSSFKDGAIAVGSVIIAIAAVVAGIKLFRSMIKSAG